MQDMKQILQFLAAAAAFSVLMSGCYSYQPASHGTLLEKIAGASQPDANSGGEGSGAGTSN